MIGLPKSTEFSKQLPKKAIYEKFNMNTAAKEKFDADISRINIVAEISPHTVSVVKGEAVAVIFVLQVILKHKDFAPNTISQISKLIDQNMILILECEGEAKLAVYHSKLMQTQWQKKEDLSIELSGLTMDAVGENIIMQIGGITVEQGNTLDEQIAVDEQKAKLQKEIDRLTKLAKKEKQPKKKFELVQQIQKLKGGKLC